MANLQYVNQQFLILDIVNNPVISHPNSKKLGIDELFKPVWIWIPVHDLDRWFGGCGSCATPPHQLNAEQQAALSGLKGLFLPGAAKLYVIPYPMETAATTRIRDLRQQHNALILAHYYEDGAIQDIADHVGDSLFLAQMGEAATNPVILLAGVVFMAESVKILSPQKTVLVPDPKAGCSLVDHSPFELYLAWRRRYPDAICVTYVNSSAAVKSITDVCVTSSNAEKVIQAIPLDRRILFGPDRNLGSYLATKLKREMILWPGACEVHVLFSARKLFELKVAHPSAVVVAHPECDEAVLQYADVIGSTSRLLTEVKKNPAREFIVATENGILHQMQKARPDALLIQAPINGTCACNECPYMKLNTLDKMAHALETLEPRVELNPVLIDRAAVSLQRMMSLTRGETVRWPAGFDA